ncbi:class D beta-lactamase [Pseudaminobacter sp. 19-2017]|uniref:Beta-lactamase n=1 Tax=Pseudaminobacter soli (ex Zhang et al. 2022) TaxID=2831468 RepID=A0A942E2V4_9HYPH|nr:class D beta-lactamase [Pseudaminobacter soli]MBS3652486.1 class D beta-lactamase [Pseudaminobacter soli]
MRGLVLSIVAVVLALTLPASAETKTICTLIADADSGRTLVEEGDCAKRMSPASSFKIAISLMGFDAGILTSPSAPELPFRKGYASWRPEWKRPATPARWMKYSVVWYSQQVTQRLGEKRFKGYVEKFGYGNRDVSGDPGKANGLTNAWLSSSLQISPAEQVDFLRKLVRRELPVSEAALANTAAILDYGVQPGGWQTYGKTGTGIPRGADGRSLKDERFGWFVGWAQRDGRTVVFARLIKDSPRQSTPQGLQARDGLMADLFGEKSPLD